MTLKDVKKGLNEKLQEIFPINKYKYYSMAVVEDYERPCFFTQLKPNDTSPENYNSRNMYMTFYIDFFGKTVNEAEYLDIVQKIQDHFGLYLRISGKIVMVEDMDWDFTGTEKNHLSMSINLMWRTTIDHSVTLPTMESAKINIKMEDKYNGNA